jgi:hypothetical protein
MRSSMLGLATLVVAGLAGGCAIHKPQPTRVVVVLEGKKVDPVADQLTAMIGEQYTIVSDSNYRKVAKALDARRVSKRNVARVAERIDADAVIVGQLDKRSKKRYRLYLQLRDGSTGALKKSWSIRLRKPELGDADRPQVDAIMSRLSLIQRREPAGAEADDGERVASRSERRRARAEAAERRAEEKRQARADKRRKAEERRIAQEEEERRIAQEKQDRRQAEADRKIAAAAARGKKPAKAAAKKQDKVARAEPKKSRKPARVVDDEEEDDEPFVMEIKTDENGQVLDDERPPGM